MPMLFPRTIRLLRLRNIGFCFLAWLPLICSFNASDAERTRICFLIKVCVIAIITTFIHLLAPFRLWLVPIIPVTIFAIMAVIILAFVLAFITVYFCLWLVLMVDVLIPRLVCSCVRYFATLYRTH